MPIDNAQQLAVPMPMKNLDLNMHSSAVDGDSREIEKRTCESSIRRAFAAHYLLFVHLVIYITTFCAILFWLSGKAMRFNDNIVMEGVSFLRTSDILTIITAVLVVIRTVTASWSSLVAWRCVFLLMEKGDIDIRQANWTVSWKLLRPISFGWSGWFCTPEKSSGESYMAHNSNPGTAKFYRYCVSIILLLMWPAIFSAPLLTSSVEWVPNVELTVLKTDEVKRYQPYWKEDEIWYDYLENVIARRNLVDIMLRIFTYMSQAGVSPENCRTHFNPLRLDVNENLNIQSNRTLHNLTFPCIEISDVQWTKNETDINRLNRIVGDYQRSEVGAYNYYLSSGYVNQVQIVDMGDFPSWELQKRKYIQEKFCNPSIMGTKDVNDPEGNALFYADEVQSTFRSLMTYFFPISSSGCKGLAPFPEAWQFNGTREIAVPVTRLNSTWSCGDIPAFAETAKNATLFPTLLGYSDSPCYIAGKVNIQAGVMRRVDNGRIHPNWTLVSNVKRDVTKFEPDRWVNETMYLLPYLLHLISTANDVYRPQATNLEGYIKNVVQNAYSAIWVVLDATLNLNPDKYDPGKSTFMSDITFMMRARIKKQRLYAWLALNLLFTISGILHLLLERLSSRPIIVDTAAAALTTDVSRLLADPQIAKLKWRNMSYVTKEDVFGSEKELCSDNRIRLKLERLGDGFGLSRKLD
ncbi:hypothetical protein FPQ18DRAFT_301090 [Pyronema domesticum]|nr:hypothetical protein FPQ18DRAFT_301090 [Pyronema domesticum]